MTTGGAPAATGGCSSDRPPRDEPVLTEVGWAQFLPDGSIYWVIQPQ